MATEDNLREALAARFANIFIPRVTDALPYARLHEWQKMAWREMADECLRQMEWTQRRGIRFGLVCRGLREGIVTDSPSGADEIDAIAKRDGLTLAPEDWTPPKEG